MAKDSWRLVVARDGYVRWSKGSAAVREPVARSGMHCAQPPRGEGGAD